MGNCFGRCLSSKNGLRHSTDEQEEELVHEEILNNNNNNSSNKNFIFKIMKFKKKKRPNFIDSKYTDHRRNLNYSKLSQENPSMNSIDNTNIQLQCLNAQSLIFTSSRETQYTKFLNQNDSHDACGNGVCGIGTSSRTSSSLDLEWEHEYGHGHVNPIHSSWLFLSDDSTKMMNFDEEEDNYDDDDDRQSENSSVTYFAKNRNRILKQQMQLSNEKKQISSSLEQNKNQSDKIVKKPSKTSLLSPSNNGIQTHHKIITRTSSRQSHNSWSHISTPDSLEWDIDEDQQNQLQLEDDDLDHETLKLLHEIELLKNKVLNETGEGLELEFIKDKGS